MSKKLYEVQLSRQDLADFLEDNADYMEQYRAELEKRLKAYGRADVSITNTLTDKITVDGEPDEAGVVAEVMNRMGNDWSWLKQ